MKTIEKSSFAIITALLACAAAYGTQPSDVVTSDGNANTAMGSNALLDLSSGTNNTAAGDNALLSNTTGSNNTAVGSQAMVFNSTGIDNTASGYNALLENSSGGSNTAVGYQALLNNTTACCNSAFGAAALGDNSTGNNNTAVGTGTLGANTTGSFNTATGAAALSSNTTGANNTATGLNALYFNSTGSDNTGTGVNALLDNTTGTDNTATGFFALYSNTTADYNTASGYSALYSNNGNSNTASGYEVLYSNTSGTQNTASGVHALAANTTGSNNIAEGYHAGYNLTTGSNNIDIGSPGVAAESGIIRIGTITGTTSTQKAAYVAGIYGVKTGTAGTAVFIDSSGQLGTVSSSIRYKEDVQPIASASERLLQLRPVRFRYKKADASGEKPIQYGLIAEEVAEVYPELVVRDATTGRIDGVRYDELAPMLLNEMQQQHAQMAEKFDTQARANTAQAAEIRELKQQQIRTEQQVGELKALNETTQAALRKLQAKDEFVGQR